MPGTFRRVRPYPQQTYFATVRPPQRISRKSTKLRSFPDCGVSAVGPPSALQRLYGGTPEDQEVSWVASQRPASTQSTLP